MSIYWIIGLLVHNYSLGVAHLQNLLMINGFSLPLLGHFVLCQLNFASLLFIAEGTVGKKVIKPSIC